MNESENIDQDPTNKLPGTASREQVFALMLAPDDSYNEDARAFVEFLKANDLDLTKDSLHAYAEWLEQPHDGKRYSAATYNKRIAGAKKRIRYLFEKSPDSLDLNKRYRLDSALSEIKAKKINSVAVPEDKTLEPEEIERVIEGLAENPFPGSKRIGYMVRFLSLTGVRISEMLGILLSDIKANNGKSIIRIHGKGKKERDIMVSKDVVKKIRDEFAGKRYLFEHAGRTYNPKYVTNQIRMAGKLILGKEISAHTLRHSFATNKLKQTNNLKGVSKYLGHASTSLTADLYVHDELKWEDVADL